MALDLEPMSIGDILDRAVRLYRRNFFHALGIVALPQLIVVPWGMLLNPDGRAVWELVQTPRDALNLSLFYLAAIALSSLSVGALTLSISERYLGRSPGIWTAIRPVLRRAHSLLWVFLLGLLVEGGVLALGIGLPMVVSTLVVVNDPRAWPVPLYVLFAVSIGAAVIGFLIIFSRLSLVVNVVIMEGLRGPGALQRSWKLMRGNFWRLVLLFVFWNVIAFIAGLVFGAVAGLVGARVSRQAYVMLFQLAGAMANVLALPLLVIPFVLLYYDSRIRKEAFDLEVMASNLGMAAAARQTSPPTGPARDGVTPATARTFPRAGPSPRAHPAVAPSAPPPAGPRAPAGAFKSCPQCGAQVPLIRPTCPGCGSRVPFSPTS